MATAASAYAIPAYTGKQVHTQPDGTLVEYTMMGDEHCHAIFDAQGRQLQFRGDWLEAKALPETTPETFGEYYKAALRRSPHKVVDIDGFPTIGEVRGLILLVNFTDAEMQPQYDIDVFKRRMNEVGCTEYGATGSARDYFMSQSYGKFMPTFDIYGPVPLQHSYAYYGANDGFGNDRNAAAMISEACQYAHDNYGVDFADYDFDNDGEVDFVYVIYAGHAESYGASENTIWPHASRLEAWGIDCELDGKKVNMYACSCELKYATGTTLEGIGTFCHEFGHVLGLPDIYNTRATSTSYNLGYWDIMDQGCYNNGSNTPASYSSFERFSLGWLEYTVLDTPAFDIELPEITENDVAYVIPTKNQNEFFTLENRQRKNWDKYQPGTGMLILHIDYDETAWRNNMVNAGLYPRYDLVEADGTLSTGEASDLFPGTLGNTYFTDFSDPAMTTNDGEPVGRGINHITETADGLITFDYMHDRVAVPKGLALQAADSHSLTLQWEPVEEATGYCVSLQEVLPAEEQKCIIREDFSLMTEGEYPKSDYYPMDDEIDNYTLTPGWSGTDAYQCGGEVRIGSYGQSGELRTPYFACEGIDALTIAVKAQSYTGKKVNFTVALETKNGEIIASETYNTNKDLKDFIIRAAISDGTYCVRVNTAQERLFIDDLFVIKGDVPDEEVWDVDQTISLVIPTEECTLTISALKAERTYRVKVMACGADVTMDSDWSDEIAVTTEKDIESINASEYNRGKVQITGNRVSVSCCDAAQQLIVTDLAGRIVICDTPTSQSTYTIDCKGVFIVRYGTAVQVVRL